MNFNSKIAVLNTDGGHLRYVHRELAAHLVTHGNATAREGFGKIREITLTHPASGYAERIGEPSDGRASGVRFHRWVRLEQSAALIVEHHPRCLWIECE